MEFRNKKVPVWYTGPFRALYVSQQIFCFVAINIAIFANFEYLVYFGPQKRLINHHPSVFSANLVFSSEFMSRVCVSYYNNVNICFLQLKLRLQPIRRTGCGKGPCNAGKHDKIKVCTVSCDWIKLSRYPTLLPITTRLLEFPVTRAHRIYRKFLFMVRNMYVAVEL
jgi:hypothetical protein